MGKYYDSYDDLAADQKSKHLSIFHPDNRLHTLASRNELTIENRWKMIEFIPDWVNSTGHYNNIIGFEFSSNHLMAAVDPYERLLIIVVHNGTCKAVLFNCHSMMDPSVPCKICCSIAHDWMLSLKPYFPSIMSDLSDDAIQAILKRIGL